LLAASLAQGSDSADGAAFFEQRIRPLLIERCYKCHSAQAAKVKGGLYLDSNQGMRKGGVNGAILVPGDPGKSRLIDALKGRDPDLKMPPGKQFSSQQIEWFETWIKMGAPDPRDTTASTNAGARSAMGLDSGRQWWAFQPVKEVTPTSAKDERWAQRKIDRFILAKLEAAGLKPSPEVDKRTLIRRAYLDLTGLRPSFEEIEAFARDDSPEAYAKLIDYLLASEHYGERWGRYWLDVVRYAEDNPTGEATNPPYPFAWRYRDWVIRAINEDMPYDRFVKLQLAADEMTGVARRDMVALGFLGSGPVYHKDLRLSKEVITTLCTDDWDERIDTVTRAFLGLTVACARCHDHKFDPISTKDYYALQGIFASVVQAPRPLADDIAPEVESRFMAAEQRLFFLSYAANLLRGEPGSKPKEARRKVGEFVAAMDRIKHEMSFLQDAHPDLYAELDQLARRPQPYRDEVIQLPKKPAPAPPVRRRTSSSAPFFQAVFDAGTFVDATDGDFTWIDIKPGVARDMNVLAGGNVSRPGEVAPRRFLSVLSKDDAAFHAGSGRRELGEKIFGDAAQLAARVIVNRVWAWHFGKPLVATPSDFGAQGEAPTHPELLDDLAARFIACGWSLKWLHREIMLSSAHQQASQPREDAMALDPTNRLLWRMNPRRLDVEAYRDCVLQAAGVLNRKVGGVSSDLDQPDNVRRTVYARVSRGRMNNLFQLFDFPAATMHSPGRETTTTPLQQLFVLNSAFMQKRASALGKVVERAPEQARVQNLYKQVLGREPDKMEQTLAGQYFAAGGKLADYAQALLSTNEVTFWP
jgi:hypothetical protein